MKKVINVVVFVFLSMLLNNNLSAQYCSAGTTICDEYISNVTCGTINNSTSCSSGGYANYTSFSTSIIIGNPQSISVTNGTFYSGDYVDVWIDLNHDNLFTDAGDQVVHYAQTGSTTSTSFTVPVTALSGPTRMRVSVTYYSTTSPCGTSYYGEYEDYTVNLIAPTPPNAPSASALPSTLFCGTGSILTATSTTTGAMIRWWDAATGGNMLGVVANGSTFPVLPFATTTYYAEAYNGIPSTTRTPVTVIVYAGSLSFPVVSANPSINCLPGSISDLTGTGTGVIRWWDSPSGGTLLGTSVSGAAFPVNPTVTSIYYAQSYAACGSSTRVPDTVFVNGLPTPTSANSSPSSIICGTPVNLSASTSVSYINWYTTSTGGTPIGTSENGTNLTLTPTTTTTYYAEAANGSPFGGQTFNYTGSIVTWNVPTAVSSITITAAGASGGFNSNTGGRGAIMTGTFTVIPGQALSIIVGQCPGATSSYPGGGGGTFVASGSAYSSATPLIVGGGGGGGYSSNAGVDAPTSQAGTYTSVSYLGANGYGAIAAPCVGGGGGFYSSGAADTYYSYDGGGGFQQGGAGGCANPSYDGSSYQCGGFGGGTAGDYYGSCNTYSGNGGGYSGGSGYNTNTKYYGEAGGSYNGGTNQVNLSGTSGNTGNGYVLITWSSTYCTSAGRASVTVNVSLPSTPVNVISSPSVINCGGSSNLNATSNGGYIRWWDAPVAGNLIGSSANGTNFSVSPIITTVYYAETYSICGVSSRVSVKITLNQLPPPTGASASPSTLLCGDSTHLSAISAGSSISWWDAASGGNLIGTSQSGSNFTLIPALGTYYAATSVMVVGSDTINYSGNIVTWTVPSGVNALTIQALGASGGYTSFSTPGYGAEMQGTFSLSSGLVLSILAGQCPGLTSSYPGGGGGTFVALGSNYTTAVPLIVAGGGGGGYSSGVDAPTGTGGTGLYPGINGSGAPAVDCGGGGGGFYSSGGNDLWYGYSGGEGFQDGGVGGGGHGGYQPGGFGGGAEADYDGSCNTVAGAGGGYSGGSGENSGNFVSGGQAGGSFNGGSNQVNVGGYNNGNGQVVISWNQIICISTTRMSVSITLTGTPPPPISITSMKDTICLNDSSALYATDNIGYIKWYTQATGGVAIGSTPAGYGYPVKPTITTTYYAETNACSSSSSRISFTITVITNSTQANFATASPLVICPGYASTLSLNGGSLSNGSQWNWYSSGCGANFEGIGDSLTVYPIATTEYYVRAENQCSSTNCVSVTITANNITLNIGNDTTVCTGASIILTATVTGIVPNSFYWYENGNTSQAIGTGQSVTVFPTANTAYYVNVVSSYPCSDTLTGYLTVDTLNTIPVPSLVSTGPQVCSGVPSYVYADCLTGVIRWWTSPSGGTLLGSSGSGAYFTVLASSDTVFYAENFTSCGSSPRVADSLNVDQPSTLPVSISASNTSACTATYFSLSVNGGTLGANADWYWYSNSCGSVYEGNGTNLSVYTGSTTTYFVRAEDQCFTSTCLSTTIVIGATADIGSNVYICNGDTITITANSQGVSLDSYYWYNTGNSSQSIGYSSSITVAPSVTTTYYVVTSSYLCSSSTFYSNYKTVTVVNLPQSPDSVYSSPVLICQGNFSSLSASSTGNLISWWNSITGGSLVGTSASDSVLLVSPSTSTTYYAEAVAYYADSLSFTYTGSIQNWQVPAGVNKIYVDMAGASGSDNYSGNYGGYGGRVQAGIDVVPGDILYIYVGGQGIYNGGGGGAMGDAQTLNSSLSVDGGWNGGGGIYGSCGGGGASDIRLADTSLASRVIVAGGGGGAGALCEICMNNGGDGGGSDTAGNGLDDNGTYDTVYCGGGANIVRGGFAATYSSYALTGTFGYGGDGGNYGGGGGGGFFGGGGGDGDYSDDGGGGGGSSWVTPAGTSNIVHTQGYQYGDGYIIISWNGLTSCASSRISVVVAVDTISYPPLSLNSTQPFVCPGIPSILSISGGNLGTAANWAWYSGSCGGVYLGSGSLLSVNPTVETNYYVRAEGLCNTTICDSTIININTASIAPFSVTPAAICQGNFAVLSITGGALGTFADWQWYTGNCGINNVAEGLNPVVTPSVTTTFWVRAEGICNTTACISVIITVNTFSVPASSLSGTTPICSGGSTTLGISGGLLGTAANWYWYSGSCGGLFEGIGASLPVNPSMSTSYFVRAEGTCNSTNCSMITITVNEPSAQAYSITATNSVICPGDTATLLVSGGALGTGANWYWYSGSCGGQFEGNGFSLAVSPVMTTSYFVRAEGQCNTTNCLMQVITANTSSFPADSVMASNTMICTGGTTSLTVSGGTLGTGANWYWYNGSCGGQYQGNGYTLPVYPSTSVIYYVRAEGACNTTNCSAITITVNSLSYSPDSVTVKDQVICPNGTTNLLFFGGALGTGADWYYYTGSCGSQLVGNGVDLILIPAITTVYYVRAEGVCNTTSCLMATVTVNTLSFAADSATTANSVICPDGEANLYVSGGSLGTGADWFWYSGSCGGVFAGNGSNLTVSPFMTTDYYVRAEGICNTTNCSVISITVDTLSFQADSVIATNTVICPGSMTTLEVSGGVPGTGADWYWYSGTCGGEYEGNGTSLTISPAITTDYFVRAEGICNTTICTAINIIVNSISYPVDSVTATNSTICSGESAELGISGGVLGTGADWYWYSGSCGGSPEGNGPNITVIPGMTTIYFVRAESACNTTNCALVTIFVNTLSVQADSAMASDPAICSGGITQLFVYGGALGTGADWYWYTGACGGQNEGNGININVNPAATTVYYVRAEGICDSTNCSTVTVFVNSLSSPPDSVTVSNQFICPGSTATLGITGGILGAGADWYWYSGTCGGQFEGNGASIIISPSIITDYFVRAEGLCDSTNCSTVTIYLNSISIPADSIVTGNSSICSGSVINLVVAGGSTGTNADWYWYSGLCGGEFEGNGNNLTVSPVESTTYYLRAEGLCNITGCSMITINVNPLSVQADSVIATNPVICPGAASNLVVSGGYLANGDGWYWYSSSCGGQLEGNGNGISVYPVVNTTYFVRAEGICDTTNCSMINITVNELSIASDSIIAINQTICSGDSSVLAVSGGIAGTGANWQWYSGSCGGLTEGNGISIIVNPSITTDYYVRAEGVCDTTICSAKTIFVNSLSITADSITTIIQTICSGNSATLNVAGGTLGTGATWQWYTGSCGGLMAGNGTSITVSPAITTDYYVRAEGICDTTTCSVKTIFLNSLSIPVDSVIATNHVICNGDSATLDVSGGILGTGAGWVWYGGSCGGTFEGDGNMITVKPTMVTSYYVRAEGDCNTTGCSNITIVVNLLSDPPDSIIASGAVICPGETDTLGIHNGVLGTGADWNWYTVSCGGQYYGSGTGLIVSPSITTTYYLRAEGTCNTTPCVNVNIIVNSLSVQADSVLVTNLYICTGASTTLSVAGGMTGTGADWFWYGGSCGGQYTGMGSVITVSPVVATDYYVRAEGTCGTTSCVSISIGLNSLSLPPDSINAIITAICPGSSTTLGVSGGLLGTGANWMWYAGSCGGLNQGNGASIVVTPSITTDYYLRAEGVCNTTNCSIKTISVYPVSIPADSATALISIICPGAVATLGISGGSAGTGGSWYWYSGSCGGQYVGSGQSLTANPTISSNYYVRAESLCNTTTCVSKFITLNSVSTPPASVSANPAVICNGSSSSLTFLGGFLGTGANWAWYNGSCGGSFEGAGATITVNPSANTSYFVRAEGTCNTTSCANISIIVDHNSLPPDSAISTSNVICSGTSATLGIAGGSLANIAAWYWYSGTCGGNFEGNGSTLIVIPAGTIVYYVRAEGVCNTTSCVSETIIVNSLSVTADSITASPSVTCPGNASSLVISGGFLGTNAGWRWYSSSCGGTPEGNGLSLNVTPSVTTEYYVRAEGICNSTICVSSTITVNLMSIIPDSVIVSAPSICPGDSATLGFSGGLQGYGATWNWYSGSCGNTFAGGGASIKVSPAVTTVFYIRAEGQCNTTGCVSKIILVNTNSSPADSLIVTNAGICPGSSATLSISGGNTGTGAGWMWYIASCGGTIEGNGPSITVSPVITTTYYARAEGVCDTTLCVNKTINVNSVSVIPDSVSTASSSVCQGSSATLNISGGSLGLSANWYWYSGSCGSTFEGNGISLVVNPAATTIYYARAEGICNTTLCASITINILVNSLAADSAIATANPICPGSSTTLSVTGGSTGSGSAWVWYSSSCGGVLQGTGTSLIVSPAATVTYYARAEGTCNTTACVSRTIQLNTNSIQAVSATVTNSSICSGTSVTLGITGGTTGTGADWYWYSISCGGTPEGTGTSIIKVPAATTTYFVRAEGLCNTTLCVSRMVIVNTYSVAANSISNTNPLICEGQSSTLAISGGTLGTGALWHWYTASCGGTPLANGNSVTVSPSSNTAYYARAEGICNSTTCVSAIIDVNDTSLSAGAITYTSDTICNGSSVTLGITGGNLGTAANWYWYDSACGGIIVASGLSAIVNPSITTAYYLRAEGSCNTTTCINKIITVISVPVPVLSSNSPVCYGDTLKLFCSAAMSYLWAGTGSFTSTLQNPESPDFTGTGTYYVTITGTFGCTSSDSINVSLLPLSSIQGVLKYSGGVLSSASATIELFKEENSIFMFFDSTAYSGSYSFNNVQPGNYLLKAIIHGTQYPDILPTYFDSTFQWQHADTIIVPCNTILNKDVIMYELTPPAPGGIGTISGNIWYLNAGSKSIGEPVPGAEVFLSQEPGDNPISNTSTDTSGYYGFNNIPVGVTYTLLVDIPGFPLITTYSIHLTQYDFAFQHINFIVDTSDTGRGIYRQNGTGISSNLLPGFTINVYPNPFKDNINISYDLSKSSEVRISILDILGREVKTIVAGRQDAGNYSYIFGGKESNAGSEVYFIRFVIDNNIYIKKVIRKE